MVLYFRDDRFNENKSWLPYVLGLLRTIGVAGLAILLLSPLLKLITEEVKKPKLVFLEDVSQSVYHEVSDEAQANYKAGIEEMKASLAESYEIASYQFGEEVIPAADTMQAFKTTNISKAVQYAYDVFNDQNLSALVVSSDGLFNEGRNPLYLSTPFKSPVYTIGQGDTTIRKDVLIKNVFFNRIAYLGDKFTIQVDVQAFNAVGSRTTLSVQKESGNGFQKIKDIPISIKNNSFFTTETITLDASTPGVNRYRLSLSPVSDEKSRANNIQDIYIEVLDARLKILLLANAPHPDLAAINQMLSVNKNYEIEVKYADDKNVNVSSYDFAILHNLPSRRNNIENQLAVLNRKRSPRMYIVGAQTNLTALNRQQSTLQIIGNNTSQNQIQAIPANGFSLFSLEENTAAGLTQFVPLSTPFAEFKPGPNTATLLYQKIGDVETKYPLLAFSEENGLKTAIFTAEGIWRWKLFDFLQHQNFDITKDILAKTITYTSVKEDKRKFRVNSSKNIYKENEHIFFDGQLYNNSYQLINDPDVSLSIKNNSGQQFDYTFSKRDKVYQLDAGLFPEGNYSYDAQTNVAGQQLNQKGKFTVQSIQLELFNTTADHSLLKQISQKYNGEFFVPQELIKLQTILESEERTKPTVYATTTTKSVINFKWLFGLLFFLLALEWFLRRYFGSY